MVGVCAPAKPRWSEVMIFWSLLLRHNRSLIDWVLSNSYRAVGKVHGRHYV